MARVKSFSMNIRVVGLIIGGVLVSAAAYVFSHWMYSVYYLGDQRLYIAFWDAAAEASFLDTWELQRYWTGSAEPIFGVMVWVASNYFEKIQFFSLVNAIFSLLFYAVLIRYKVPFVVSLLFFFNYYNVVLLIPAERLKVSFLFLLIFVLSRGLKSYIAFVFGLLSHFQNLLFLASLSFAKLVFNAGYMFTTLRVRLRDFFLVFAFGFGGVLVILLFWEPLGGKFLHYYDFSLSDAFDTVVMMTIALIFCKGRGLIASMFFPVLAAAVVVGEERISMVAFIIFSGFFISQGKTLNPVFLMILFYLNIKSFFFVQHILEHNTGFGK